MTEVDERIYLLEQIIVAFSYIGQKIKKANLSFTQVQTTRASIGTL